MKITFTVTKLPENTPTHDNIYVSGSFNGWFPDSSKFQLLRQKNGTFELTIDLPKKEFEYKFTRGSWNNSECTLNCTHLANRTFEILDEKILECKIEAWEDICKPFTASENVTLLSEKFFMPQLQRYRAIWIYLPPDYQETKTRYPVLYMHDGQNLFNDKTANLVEWQVDKTLNNLYYSGFGGCIVVGIENDEALRKQEYLPWTDDDLNNEDADGYAKFIVETLKPYVDANFRTNAAREATGILGSSFGALISFYVGLKYQNTFSRIGLFSPSFWITNKITDFIEDNPKKETMRIFFLVGGKERARMTKDAQDVYNKLFITGFDKKNLRLAVRPKGEHNEFFWRNEFSQAFKWMFSNGKLIINN